MPKHDTTIVTGEFDHTEGVYRLTVEIPINTIIELDHKMGRYTAETMLWIADLIRNKANSLKEEEFARDPLSSIIK